MLVLDAILVGNLANQFLRVLRQELKLNETQFWIVFLLANGGQTRKDILCSKGPSELAHAMAAPESRVVTQLGVMIERKLVVESGAPPYDATDKMTRDGRRKWYELTPLGVELASRLDVGIQKYNSVFMIAVSVRAADELRKTSDALLKWSGKGALDGPVKARKALRLGLVKAQRRNF